MERRDSGNYSATGTTAIERVKGARMIVGYGAVFFNERDADGTQYKLAPGTLERIAPTAFDSTLNSDFDVIGAYNHNEDYLLGRRSNGTLRLSKDTKGLRYEIDYNEADPQHVSVMAKIRRGDLNGSSFSFKLVDEKVESTRSGFIRTIKDVILYELGPVWAPAYKSASAGARGSASGAEVGSVRWCHENPSSPESRAARIRQIERDIEADRRREAVARRLRILQLDADMARR